MIELAQRFFLLPPDHTVSCCGAEQFLQQPNSDQYDLIFSDLHMGAGHADCLDHQQFHQQIYRRLAPRGVYVSNLLPCDNDQMLRWLLIMRRSFSHVVLLPLTDKRNIVVFGFKQPPLNDRQLAAHTQIWDQNCNTRFGALIPALVPLPTPAR